MILLHGLGASGADLYPLAEHLLDGKMRVVCPHAPARPVSVNGGMHMPAWYDIAGTDLESRQDAAGIRQSAARIQTWLGEEIARGFAPQKIFLAGFSQGAAMSVFAGLRCPHRLAGVAALSGYMLLGETLADEAAAANRNTPIFQAHGVFDPVVLPQWARQCRDELQAGGWRTAYQEYPAAHAIPPQTILDLNKWLKEVLENSEDAENS